MTLEQFNENPCLYDGMGDPIKQRVKDTKGNILADFDLDWETHELEGVDYQELHQRQVLSVEDHGYFLEVTVQ